VPLVARLRLVVAVVTCIFGPVSRLAVVVKLFGLAVSVLLLPCFPRFPSVAAVLVLVCFLEGG
jgi:hypothetical protein